MSVTTVDLRSEGPLTLEALLLSQQLEVGRSGCATPEVLLTLEQHRDIYAEIQTSVRFETVSAYTFNGMTLRS